MFTLGHERGKADHVVEKCTVFKKEGEAKLNGYRKMPRPNCGCVRQVADCAICADWPVQACGA
jgi:hypothetical protein